MGKDRPCPLLFERPTLFSGEEQESTHGLLGVAVPCFSTGRSGRRSPCVLWRLSAPGGVVSPPPCGRVGTASTATLWPTSVTLARWPATARRGSAPSTSPPWPRPPAPAAAVSGCGPTGAGSPLARHALWPARWWPRGQA